MPKKTKRASAVSSSGRVRRRLYAKILRRNIELGKENELIRKANSTLRSAMYDIMELDSSKNAEWPAHNIALRALEETALSIVV